jgi:tetraacyldisaccharide 4'-kinase
VSRGSESRRSALEHWINRFWYGPAPWPGQPWTGALRVLLTPLEWLFALITGLRRRGYRSGWLVTPTLKRPVAVVGNLSVGGTGKTPMTVFLARALTSAGVRTGIISRGYRAGGAGHPVRVDAHSDPARVGDEPVLIALQTGCAVAVGRDRVAAARLLEEEVDLILSDDGMQHLRLPRALEIALVDAERGLGNGRLLPCGPLREPGWRLRHADFVVLTGAEDTLPDARRLPVPGVSMPLGQRPIRAVAGATDAVSLHDGRRRPLAEFTTGAVHAVAGIANPERFFALLRGHGLDVIAHPLADHAAMSPKVIAFADGLPVLMTDKDGVKCQAFADARCWAVPLDVTLEEPGRTRLLSALLALAKESAEREC